MNEEWAREDNPLIVKSFDVWCCFKFCWRKVWDDLSPSYTPLQALDNTKSLLSYEQIGLNSE